MSTDYRALCAELATELEAWEKADDQFSEGGTIRADANYGLAPRARTALAQPEPVGVTYSEVLRIRDELDTAGLGTVDLVDFARAVLQRWGRPAIEPVPVSERLPGLEDCDAEGRCWFYVDELGNYDEDFGWKLLDRSYGCNSGRSHWLPAHDLPLPAAPGERE